MAIRPMTFDSTVSAVAVSHDTAFDLEAIAKATATAKESNETVTLMAAYYGEALTNPGVWRQLLGDFRRDGHEPTEFILGPMTGEDLARLEDECLGDEPKRSELYWRSFLLSVKNITAFDCKDAPKVQRKGRDYLDPDWLSERFAYGELRKVAKEIGMLAYSWNQVQAGELKN